jgi:hypothetical protein
MIIGKRHIDLSSEWVIFAAKKKRKNDYRRLQAVTEENLFKGKLMLDELDAIGRSALYLYLDNAINPINVVNVTDVIIQ